MSDTIYLFAHTERKTGSLLIPPRISITKGCKVSMCCLQLKAYRKIHQQKTPIETNGSKREVSTLVTPRPSEMFN